MNEGQVKDGRLIVNGHDLTDTLVGYRFESRVGEPPILELHLIVTRWADDGSLVHPMIDRSSTPVLK